MDSAALAAEMRDALRGLDRIQADFLVSYGVNPLLISVYQMVGVAQIGPGPSRGLWVPSPEGEHSFVTPVRCHDILTPLAPDPYMAPRLGHIVDLIAWCPKQPDKWLLRTGEALWAGSAALPQMDPFPVYLRTTVLKWLQADADGLVLLSEKPHHCNRILSAVGRRAMVEDKLHLQKLSAALAAHRHSLQPQLLLPGSRS